MKKIYFSDFFNVDRKTIEEEGFFDISLLNDLPLFIDPFLIFCSEKEEYQNLHQAIIRYMVYLRDFSLKNPIPTKPMLKALYRFPEVKQNYLGFCKSGNGGSALGNDFAKALHSGLQEIFSDFGEEKITKSPHLEKLCLIKERVGKDSISDFTTNLIKGFLLEQTEKFAKKYIDPSLCKTFYNIQHVNFDYNLGVWKAKSFFLPCFNGDFVILTPIDLLVKTETWINKHDLYNRVEMLSESLEDSVLRFQVNQYFMSFLSEKPTEEEKTKAATETLIKYPQLIDMYIKSKEDDEQGAINESVQAVDVVKKVFVDQIQELVELLRQKTDFYKKAPTSYEEAMQRVLHLKQVIEDGDGYRLFYDGDKPIRREEDIHLMYKLACYDTISDVNSEVNNGRGPVDFKVSNSRKDKTIVEFKLTRTLKKNLEKQVEVYKNANQTNLAIKVIIFFTDEEEAKTYKILNELKLTNNPHIVLIDARSNKIQASKAK